MKIRELLNASAILTLGLAPTFSAAADPPAPRPVATALGDEGQLYEVIPGTFAQLFPEDGTQTGDTPVLALDVVAPDGSRERFLLPGSEGPEVDTTPSVVFEDSSSRLYAAWESKRTPTVSRLLLTSFGDGGWSEPIEISGDVSPLKDEPRILITRDRFSLHDESGERTTRSRTAIHVVWREEGAEGSGLFYTPVIIEAGRYLGWNPVVPVAGLEPEAAESDPGTEVVELLRAPELAAGQDVHSAVLGYLSPTSGRLLIVEARLLPGEIGFLGDDIRADIIEIGARDPGKVEALAERCRADIIEIGHRLNGGVVRHFAERARSSLLVLPDSEPDRPITAVADDIRADIIEIGADLFGGPGIQRRQSKLLEIAPEQGAAEPPGGTGPATTHLVLLRLVSDRPAPPLDGIPAKIFVSEDGERALVGWAHQGKVYYTESSAEPGPGGEAWAPVKHMTLTERLGIPEAVAILESRVRRQR